MDIVVRLCILFIIIIVIDRFLLEKETFNQASFDETMRRVKKFSEEEGLQIRNDVLFEDVVYYGNEGIYEEDKTGLEKCREECDGRCIEFGVSGNANCFPRE